MYLLLLSGLEAKQRGREWGLWNKDPGFRVGEEDGQWDDWLRDDQVLEGSRGHAKLDALWTTRYCALKKLVNIDEGERSEYLDVCRYNLEVSLSATV